LIIGECECGGGADGPHRPIERFRPERFNRRITDDAPYRWTGLSVERRRSRRNHSCGCGTQTRPRFIDKKFESVDGGEGGKLVIDPAFAGHVTAVAGRAHARLRVG